MKNILGNDRNQGFLEGFTLFEIDDITDFDIVHNLAAWELQLYHSYGLVPTTIGKYYLRQWVIIAEKALIVHRVKPKDCDITKHDIKEVIEWWNDKLGEPDEELFYLDIISTWKKLLEEKYYETSNW